MHFSLGETNEPLSELITSEVTSQLIEETEKPLDLFPYPAWLFTECKNGISAEEAVAGKAQLPFVRG